jgi:hypothetical protein
MPARRNVRHRMTIAATGPCHPVGIGAMPASRPDPHRTQRYATGPRALASLARPPELHHLKE